MPLPHHRWITRWSLALVLVGLIAIATHSGPDAPSSLVAGAGDPSPGSVWEPAEPDEGADSAEATTTTAAGTQAAPAEGAPAPSTPPVRPKATKPTTSTTPPTAAATAPTTRAPAPGASSSLDEQTGIEPTPLWEVPKVSSYPATWVNPAGAQMPVISCGSGYYQWRCFPAVWPPPELGFDPCANGYGPAQPFALTHGFRGADPLRGSPIPGWTEDDQYVALSWEGSDCVFHLFEGIRFVRVHWNGPNRGRVGATIDWGDGTFTTADPRTPGCGSPVSEGGQDQRYSNEYGHKYKAAGTYTMKVHITSGYCTGTQPDSPMTEVETVTISSTRTVFDRYVIE